MISTRILDNDMGHVMKVPLTGRGTIHGITIDLSIEVGKEIKKYSLPELDVGLLEMLSPDMGLSRFKDHAEEHLNDPKIEEKFVETYKMFMSPLNKSKVF
jgi:hypothetical protein